MPTEDHANLMSELRSTRSVRASTLTFANSVHQRLKIALEANSGNGDFSALRALCDDLSPTHRDDIASALIHGTSSAPDDKDADPTAPTPASNPGSLGGNVYGSKGPEDTDTNRDGGTGGNRSGLTPPEEDARKRQELGAEARNREEREKNERNAGDGRTSTSNTGGMDPDRGVNSDVARHGDDRRNERGLSPLGEEGKEAGAQHQSRQNAGLTSGREDGAQQQDRPAGASRSDRE